MCYSGHTLCYLGGKSPQRYSSEDRNNVNGDKSFSCHCRCSMPDSLVAPIFLTTNRYECCWEMKKWLLVRASRLWNLSHELFSISVEGIISFILPLRRLSTKHRAIIGCLWQGDGHTHPEVVRIWCQRVGSGQPQKVAPNESPPVIWSKLSWCWILRTQIGQWTDWTRTFIFSS